MKFSNIVFLFVLGIAILLGIGVFALSLYNIPSVVDDICFSYTVQQNGFAKAVWMYYSGWSGRYVSTVYYSLNPLVWGDSRLPFIIIPNLLFVIFFAALFYLGHAIFKNVRHEIWAKTLLLGFGVIYFLNIPSLAEALFWYSGTYTLVSIILLLIFLKQWYDISINGKVSSISYLGLFLSYFLLLGSSEVIMLCISFVIVLFIGWQLYKTRKFSKLNIGLLLLTFLGNALVIFAPGNAVRKMQNRNVLNAIYDTLYITQKLLLEWIGSPTLILFSVAFLIFTMGKKNLFKRIQIPLPISIILSVGLLLIAFFPLIYGLGLEQYPPGRILNLIYFLFVLLWFYNLSILSAFFKSKAFKPKLVYLLLGTLLVFALYENQNLKTTYRDLKYGAAENYLMEYEKRREVLLSDKKSVTLKKFRARPKSFFVGDLAKDPNYLWNSCLADYYKKDWVYLED